jgi:uncharacterized membrane protein YfhO
VNQLQLADGVNPLQLKNYWQYMAESIGFDPTEYSVTLPPFPDGNPSYPHYQDLDTRALGLLNVRYVVSAYSLVSEKLNDLYETRDEYIYENLDVRPRAWIASDSTKMEQGWRNVDSFKWSPNSITIRAQGGGFLVLSEVVYPGWEASINGKSVEIETYHGLLRSVPLQEGDNLIQFNFHPWTVYLGTAATFLTVVILIFIWWRK